MQNLLLGIQDGCPYWIQLETAVKIGGACLSLYVDGLQYLPLPDRGTVPHSWGPIHLVLGSPGMCGYPILHVSSVDSIPVLMFLYAVLEAAPCLPNVDWVTAQGISYTALRLHSFGILLLTFIRVCIRVWRDLNTVLTPRFLHPRSILSLTPRMYDR